MGWLVIHLAHQIAARQEKVDLRLATPPQILAPLVLPLAALQARTSSS
jgi:hypothetical protein